MNRIMKYLGVILFSLFIFTSCGNSVRSDAQEMGDVYEETLILKKDYKEEKITKSEYREKKKELDDKGKELFEEITENYTKKEQDEFKEEVKKNSDKIRGEVYR